MVYCLDTEPEPEQEPEQEPELVKSRNRNRDRKKSYCSARLQHCLKAYTHVIL
jgi:hypothetical protein